jgi:phosphoribosyl-ATP pyrophosphohydrolase/phosphoribosyl-AMP cyclohydrolase
MIVPSIDLRGGQTVQLIGGEKLAIEAGDPRPIAERFARVGEIAVIDLDAALSTGSNAALIEDLCARHACRVGGGLRDEATCRRWLDAGAARIILGTAATPALLSRLPRERLIAALDARDGEVVTHGWTTRTGANIADRIAELRPYVSGFLITFVEKEGRLGGTAMDRVQPLIDAAGDRRITFAGGVTTAEEIAALDRIGADAQVGMALYTGRLALADAFAAPLVSDRPDGLWATVVTDERGQALGLCWSNPESLARAIDTGRGVYWSRRRGLWEKGRESGHVQQLVRVDVDCDRDALRFVVRQHGPGFCHLGCATCWGPARGLDALGATLADRVADAPAGSYTRRLLDDPTLLASKLREEAGELAEARDPDHVAEEAADLLYFAAVALARAGKGWADVERALDRRALRVSRRAGDAKPGA